MKKIFIVLMAGTVLLMNACKKDDEHVPQTQEPENKELSIPGLVDFTTELTIRSTGAWTVEIPAGVDWLDVDKKSGSGDAVLKFKCTKASTGKILQTVVKVNANGKLISISVTLDPFYNSPVTSMFAGDSYDEINKILATADGGYLVVGTTGSHTGEFTGNPDPNMMEAFVVKFDKVGEVQWKKFFGGNRNDEFSGAAATIDGGYILLGRTASNTGTFDGNKGGRDIWVQKIKANGDAEWMKLFGSTDDESGGDPLVLANGDIYISGVGGGNDGDFSSTHGGEGDIFIACLDKDGNTKWKKCYGGSKYESGRIKLIPATDGNIIFCGFTQSTNGDLQGNTIGGDQDGWICKIDAEGVVKWSKTYGGTGEDVIVSIKGAEDGSVIATGSADHGTFYGTEVQGDGDAFVLKINPEGTRQWSTLVDEGGDESFYQSTSYKGNSIVAVGSIITESGMDALLCFIDGTGKKLWTKKIGGSNLDLINNIATLKNNTVVCGGSSTSNDGQIPQNFGDFDAFFHIFN